MEERDMWGEVSRRSRKENSAMNATDFYAGDRFALFIDLRSTRDNDLHGSGLRFMDTKEVIQLAINRVRGMLNVTSSSTWMLSSTLSTKSLKAWPINEVSHYHTPELKLFSNCLKKGSNKIFLSQLMPYFIPQDSERHILILWESLLFFHTCNS